MLSIPGIYLTCTMAITTLSMVLTVFVLNLHHITDRPVPRWARTLVLVYLARLLCMCQYVPQRSDDEEREARMKKDKYRVTPNSLGKAIGNQIGLLANLNGSLGQPAPAGRGARPAAGARDRPVDQHGIQFRSHYTFQEDEQRPKKDLKKLEEVWAREWRHLAEVVDRLFFWMFLSAIVITTLLLFHPLTKAYFSLLGDETFLGGDDAKAVDATPTPVPT